jgi:hypothetical protein
VLARIALGDGVDPRSVHALDALGCLTAELDERGRRRFARNHRRGLGDLDVGFDEVRGGESFGRGFVLA